MGIGCCTRRVPSVSEKDFTSLTEAEIKLIHHFMYEHCIVKGHGHNFKIKTIGGAIGNGLTIKCMGCGEKEDITDYGSW